ncbi:MAG: arsenite efflux transporter metallochaperone ArsD [Verrucomicrobiia bacterium]
MSSSTGRLTQIEVFDPPMCCSTGVCGPEVDPKLVAFAEDLAALAREGVKVLRHNLAQDPLAFTGHAEVRALLAGGQPQEVLPLIFVNGTLAFRGRYPGKEDLRHAAERPPLVSLVPRASGSCAEGSSCC